MNLAELREKAVRASAAARIDEVQELAQLFIHLVDEVGDRLDNLEDQFTNAETPPPQVENHPELKLDANA